jgi:hypothetical protein
VAVTIERTEHGWHAGVLHRKRREPPRKTHLAFHARLMDEAPSADDAWIEPALRPELARQVAALCRMIVAQHPKGEVPYGLRFAATEFTDQGELLLGPTEHGLTCATFILAVFRRVGAALVDLASWRSRADDEGWQREIVALLERHAAKAHADAVRAEIGCVRFHPTEVAAACSRPTLPVGFDDAVAAAAELVAAFDARAEV